MSSLDHPGQNSHLFVSYLFGLNIAKKSALAPHNVAKNK
jgi:hypothetical protein